MPRRGTNVRDQFNYRIVKSTANNAPLSKKQDAKERVQNTTLIM